MAIAQVQSSGKIIADAAASAAHNFVGQPVVGNYVIVLLSRFCATGDSSVADNQGHTYTRAVQGANTGSNNKPDIWYTKITASSGTFTVTATIGTGGYIVMDVEEFSGLASSSVIDQTNAPAADGSGTSFTGGSITTTQADEVIFTVFCSGAFATVTVTGPASPYTTLASEGDGNLHEMHCSSYKIVSATETTSPVFTTSGTIVSASGCIASFKGAGGGGGVPLKTVGGLALASVKTVGGLAIASVKTVGGLSTT